MSVRLQLVHDGGGCMAVAGDSDSPQSVLHGPTIPTVYNTPSLNACLFQLHACPDRAPVPTARLFRLHVCSGRARAAALYTV